MDTRNEPIPHTDTLRLHLILDAWNKLLNDDTISDGTVIDEFSILVERINEKINDWVVK